MGDEEHGLTLTHETLLAPVGEPARQSLRVGADDIKPERLQVLVARLTGHWRKAQGIERACAADTLWALRSHVPRRLLLRVALGRSPRLMRVAALPLAGALIAAALFGLGMYTLDRRDLKG